MFAVKLLTHYILNTQQELTNIKHIHNTYLFNTISIGTPGYQIPTQNTSKDNDKYNTLVIKYLNKSYFQPF